ncbi:transmembrane protein 131 isoform X2 [Planococcus citri]|uniref:transmembrane protein 131 isoform X2 n=1 Tax=Planococcus citri TaxID=170843 RepID=UPI0031F7DFFE
MLFRKYYHLFLIWLNLVSSFHVPKTSRLSGFILVNGNLTYVEEIIPSHFNTVGKAPEIYHPNGRDTVSSSTAGVKFEPPILYFEDKVVGYSYRETVYLINTSQNKTLEIHKIAGGKCSQFQIATFGNEIVPPGGNTSFDIIFVGKDLIPVSTQYHVFTSRGIIKYDVFSTCVENPFRIIPMASVVLPLNSSYSHSVTLRNPFPEPLLITEALLHGGNHASHTLPSNIDLENAVESWTLQPYETKEILRIHFSTTEAWNLTTLQSIKLASGTTLLIPVDIEVVPRTGLYVPNLKIDFDSGGHLDPPAVRPLHLCSSSKKTVNIENVSCESNIDGCEVEDFIPTTLPPSSCAADPVAKVKFVWNAKLPGELITGGLLVQNDLHPNFRVNYTARVYHGGLTYNTSSTLYLTNSPSYSATSRPFAFTNEYRELVSVMNVYLSFEAAEYFQIRDFEPSVLKPQEQRVLFNLQMRKGVRLADVKLDSSILLETNISTVRLPLKVYDGTLTKLSKVSPSSLHLGLVSARTTVMTYFGIANTNPETIFVKYFGCNESSVRIELLDIKPGNARTFHYRSFARNETGVLHAGGFNVHPHHYASFKLSVNTSDTEGEVHADVWIQSEFQKIVFPFYMNVAKGYLRVSPDPFEFEDCFPGAFCVQQLTIESHFMRSMSILNISTIPHTPYDKLLFYPNVPSMIAGHATSIIGNILWEPTIDSSQTWPLGYLGLPNNNTGRDRWLGTIERPNITRDFDLTLIESQYLRYREQYSSPIELMFRIDTTEIKNFLFKGRIQLQWPQIVTTRVIDFPLVQIGTTIYENVSIFNPMHSHYLTVQAIMAQYYQQEVPSVVGTMMSENDFTILDSVVLNGAGAYPQLTLEGLDNTVIHLIKFSIPNEILKMCEESSTRVLNITTKRIYRLRNTGQVSVHIFGFTINGLPCQGYGFKITNCHHTPFVLKPGTTKRIEISFTPDFTSARVESTLQVESDIKMGSMLSYTLYAALDSDWLRKCKPHLQRPHWEPTVYYVMIALFFFLIIGVAIMAVYEVSAHTSRLINGFGEIEEKVEAIYDLKFIESFICRSSHAHSHSHHGHHRSMATVTHMKADIIRHSKENREIDTSILFEENNLAVDSKIANGSDFVSSNSENTKRTNDTNLPDCDELISELIRTPSVAQPSSSVSPIIKSTVCSEILSSQPIINVKNISIMSNLTADYRRNRGVLDLNNIKINDPNDTHQITSFRSDSLSEMGILIDENEYKARKGRKCDLDEACFKSKKHAKKEEKLNGVKFLKNGWTKCIKCGAFRKDLKAIDEKKCNCPEKYIVYTNDKEVAQNLLTAGSSSHNNYSKYNKELPRKLDLNKCNKKSNSSAGEVASETSSTTTETPAIIDEKEIDHAPKTPKQKKKKPAELNQKQMESSTKGSSKENCLSKTKQTVEVKKCNKDEKNNTQFVSKQDPAKNPETQTEALKPITNLPKSKEPFETLSSLCSENNNLKTKRKSNVKKRTKEDKFMNLAKELSIVFNTPDTLDRKFTANRNNVKNTTYGGKKKVEKKNQESVIKSDNSRRKPVMCNDNLKTVREESNRNVEQEPNYNVVISETNHNSISSLNNALLYSRVVAPPTRSSSSSSTSESTASFESPGLISTKIVDNRPSNSVFWESWKNDMLCQNGVMPSNSHIFDLPAINNCEERNDTRSKPMFSNYEIPEFVVLGDDERNLASESYFCKPSYSSKPENNTNNFRFPEEYDINSDEAEDTEYYNFAKGNLSDDDNLILRRPQPHSMKPVSNDIWGPPTSVYSWTPSDLSGSPTNSTSDAASALSLSRLLRFEEKKEKVKEDIEQYRSLSSLWSSDTKSLWSHPKQE